MVKSAVMVECGERVVERENKRRENRSGKVKKGLGEIEKGQGEKLRESSCDNCSR